MATAGPGDHFEVELTGYKPSLGALGRTVAPPFADTRSRITALCVGVASDFNAACVAFPVPR